LLCTNSREILSEILIALVRNDPKQYLRLLEDLDSLVPFRVRPNSSSRGGSNELQDEDPYHYDLPLQFERSKSVRSVCGYVGLRNLSNTCYLNSLFTQLFMNARFRQFMMGADIRDSEGTQQLLFETQKLFAFMQESFRKYVDPGLLVSSIRTYEDTTIDISIQMDVEEFYNLLFDRWEGQFLASDERATFRSFYGGKLVQQVTSKECEHISSRDEPFSAIQCDIKGKSTLQDSLQAYVDGELMQGGQ
jgi:ubiquitin carboxyl-terminal hydrolase 34